MRPRSLVNTLCMQMFAEDDPEQFLIDYGVRRVGGGGCFSLTVLHFTE